MSQLNNLTDDQRKQLSLVVVFDNEGNTTDRYTVIIGEEVYTMSEDPFHLQGVNGFVCKTDDLDRSHLDLKVTFEDLPEEVQRAIIDRL